MACKELNFQQSMALVQRLVVLWHVGCQVGETS